MKLSRKGEYAIKALLELASADASGTTSADIARKAQIPEAFFKPDYAHFKKRRSLA